MSPRVGVWFPEGDSGVAESGGFVVRRSRRHDVSLPVQITVASEHAPLVRLTSASPGRDGMIEADVVDLSSGGLAFVASMWLPRKCKLQFQAFAPGKRDHVVLAGRMIVQRLTMVDRRPGYLIGTSFEQPMDPGFASQLDALLRSFGEEEAA